MTLREYLDRYPEYTHAPITETIMVDRIVPCNTYDTVRDSLHQDTDSPKMEFRIYAGDRIR